MCYLLFLNTVMPSFQPNHPGLATTNTTRQTTQELSARIPGLSHTSDEVSQNFVLQNSALQNLQNLNTTLNTMGNVPLGMHHAEQMLALQSAENRLKMSALEIEDLKDEMQKFTKKNLELSEMNMLKCVGDGTATGEKEGFFFPAISVEELLGAGIIGFWFWGGNTGFIIVITLVLLFFDTSGYINSFTHFLLQLSIRVKYFLDLTRYYFWLKIHFII